MAADRAVGDSKTGDVKTWTATVGSSAPLLDDNSKGILFSIVDRSGAESVPASLDEWKPATTLYEDENKGWKRAGDVLVSFLPCSTCMPALLCGAAHATAHTLLLEQAGLSKAPLDSPWQAPLTLALSMDDHACRCLATSRTPSP